VRVEPVPEAVSNGDLGDLREPAEIARCGLRHEISVTRRYAGGVARPERLRSVLIFAAKLAGAVATVVLIVVFRPFVIGDTHVSEFRSQDGRGLVSSERRLLCVKQPYPNHNGGQLQFGPDGLLYVGMGDGGSGGDPQNRAQNLKDRLGKLLRIDPSRPGARWQIIGYGLRNPWRFSFDRANGDLYLADVGQGAWEEVDYRPRARLNGLANYGWRLYEGREPATRRGLRCGTVSSWPRSACTDTVTGAARSPAGTSIAAARPPTQAVGTSSETGARARSGASASSAVAQSAYARSGSGSDSSRASGKAPTAPCTRCQAAVVASTGSWVSR
jgi:Glucose / Sorbosone dehydrogenase